MPYRRKRYRKRKRKRRLPYRKQPSNVGRMLSTIGTAGGTALAVGLAKKALNMLNVEHKMTATNTVGQRIGNNTPGNPTLVIPLNTTIIGDTNQSRDGNQVKFISLYQQGFFTTAGTQFQLDPPLLVRILLVMVKQPGTTPPRLEEILDTTITSDVFNSPLNRDGVFKFKVISDKRIVVNPVSQSQSTATPILKITRSIKQFNKLTFRTRYLANSTATTPIYSDIEGNALVLYVFQNSISTAGDSPTLHLMTKMKFIDN